MSQGPLPVQIPSLCAKCGEKPPTIRYGSTATHTRFLIVARVRQTIHYEVPLCDRCAQKVRQQARNGLIVMGLGLLIFAGGIVWLLPFFSAMSTPVTTNEAALARSTLYQQYIPAAAPIFLGLVIAYLGRRMHSPRFASWNGKQFRFFNKTYHKAFAELNPELAR